MAERTWALREAAHFSPQGVQNNPVKRVDFRDPFQPSDQKLWPGLLIEWRL